MVMDLIEAYTNHINPNDTYVISKCPTCHGAWWHRYDDGIMSNPSGFTKYALGRGHTIVTKSVITLCHNGHKCKNGLNINYTWTPLDIIQKFDLKKSHFIHILFTFYSHISKMTETVEFEQYNLNLWKDRSTTLIMSDERERVAEKLPFKLLEKYREKHSHNDICLIFSPYIEYDDYTDKRFRYDQYKENVLKTLIERQKTILEIAHSAPDTTTDKKDIPHVLLIFDDNSEYITSHRLCNNPLLRQLFFNGRHLNITTIFKIPYYKTEDTHIRTPNYKYSPEIRSQLDYIMMYPSCNKNVNERIYHQFHDYLEKVEYDATCKCIRDNNMAFIESRSTFEYFYL